MKYFDDMNDKYGFNDGEAVPNEADRHRAVYIQAINRMAELLRSKSQAEAYDRMGVHNWCLITFINPGERFVRWQYTDDAMHMAIARCLMFASG